MKLVDIVESFSEVYISDYFEEEDIDMDDLADQAEKIANTSSINILRDKELMTVMINDKTGKVVGGLWTSFDGESYSFDVIVDSKYQNSGLGAKLIDSGMSQFNYYTDLDAKLDLHVTNPILPKFLERKYGLKVTQKHPDGSVSMS